MNPLTQVAILMIPEVIAWLKSTFSRLNPGAELPTDEEVIAAYKEAFTSSLIKDDNWLAAHPNS